MLSATLKALFLIKDSDFRLEFLFEILLNTRIQKSELRGYSFHLNTIKLKTLTELKNKSDLIIRHEIRHFSMTAQNMMGFQILKFYLFKKGEGRWNEHMKNDFWGTSRLYGIWREFFLRKLQTERYITFSEKRSEVSLIWNSKRSLLWSPIIEIPTLNSQLNITLYRILNSEWNARGHAKCKSMFFLHDRRVGFYFFHSFAINNIDTENTVLTSSHVTEKRN